MREIPASTGDVRTAMDGRVREIARKIEEVLRQDCRCTLSDATAKQLYHAVSVAALRTVQDWQDAAGSGENAAVPAGAGERKQSLGCERRTAGKEGDSAGFDVRAADGDKWKSGCESPTAGDGDTAGVGVRAADGDRQKTECELPAAGAGGPRKRACYFSAEFLIGRMVNQNLLNMGWLEPVREILRAAGRDPDVFDEIDDPALGNGGLGRLAACFLDSAATQGIPLDGYGIRYRYGLFRQSFENGRQQERADDWLRFGDPWSRRCEEDSVRVQIGRDTVTGRV